MATKKSSNRKPMTSSAKGLICLAVLAVLAVFVSCLSLTGMPLDGEGIKSLSAWVPVSTAAWPKALPLDRLLGGGSYVEYTYTLPEGGTVDASVKAIKNRMDQMRETDALVALKDSNVIRIESRNMDSSLLASQRAQAIEAGHFEFADTDGNVILTEKDISDAKVSANRVSSYSSSYTVSLIFTVNKEGQKKLADANPSYLAVTCDGESVATFASVEGNKITASTGSNDTGYSAASKYAFLIRTGAVDVTLAQSDYGKVEAPAGFALKAILLIGGLLLVVTLVYLVIIGKLTGVSAFLSVWFTVVLALFFVATVVLSTTVSVTAFTLIAVLLGLLLAMYAAVVRTYAIGKQLPNSSSPKQASKAGFKLAAKKVWIAHGGLMALALLLMILPFSRNFGYALSAAVMASALCTLVMRVFQACFTTITAKPSLYSNAK